MVKRIVTSYFSCVSWLTAKKCKCFPNCFYKTESYFELKRSFASIIIKETRSTRTIEAQLSKITQIQNPLPIPGIFTPGGKTVKNVLQLLLLQPSEIAFISNSRWQNHKEHLNRPTNNEDMVDKANRDVVSQWHLSDYREAELLKT